MVVGVQGRGRERERKSAEGAIDGISGTAVFRSAAMRPKNGSSRDAIKVDLRFCTLHLMHVGFVATHTLRYATLVATIVLAW